MTIRKMKEDSRKRAREDGREESLPSPSVPRRAKQRTGGQEESLGNPACSQTTSAASPVASTPSSAGKVRAHVPVSERQQYALLKQRMEQEDAPGSPHASFTPSHISGGGTQDRKLVKRNDKGETALHIAAKKGDLKMVKALIREGAEVNQVDYAGWTALHEAVNESRVEVVKYLLRNGANVNLAGFGGQTALHDAVGNGNEPIVRLLIKFRADPCLANDNGVSPLQLSGEREGRERIRNILLGNPSATAAEGESSDARSLTSEASSDLPLSCPSDYASPAHDGGVRNSPRLTLKMTSGGNGKPPACGLQSSPPAEEEGEEGGASQGSQNAAWHKDPYAFEEEDEEDRSGSKSTAPGDTVPGSPKPRQEEYRSPQEASESADLDPNDVKPIPEADLEEEEKAPTLKVPPLKIRISQDLRHSKVEQISPQLIKREPPNSPVGPNSERSSSPRGDSEAGESREAGQDALDEERTQRVGRTLRSHTAAQREREVKERMEVGGLPMALAQEVLSSEEPGGRKSGASSPAMSASDVQEAPFKKRKLRARGNNSNSAPASNGNNNGGGSGSGSGGGSGPSSNVIGATITGTSQQDEGSNASASQQSSGGGGANTGSSGAANAPSGGGGAGGGGGDGGRDGGGGGGDGHDGAYPKERNIRVDLPSNPYQKALHVQRELINARERIVRVTPKQPKGYQDYLLITKKYLTQERTQNTTVTKNPQPEDLRPELKRLFAEQEQERFNTALRFQSERERLILFAEEEVLRANNRAARAIGDHAKPYSFCSMIAYKDATSLPQIKSSLVKDENVRDRFTSRTFVGWLQDSIAEFDKLKRELLNRQMHEAEGLMMVQKMDWLKELKVDKAYDRSLEVKRLEEIPHTHVPLVSVSLDFRIFQHDQV